MYYVNEVSHIFQPRFGYISKTSLLQYCGGFGGIYLQNYSCFIIFYVVEILMTSAWKCVKHIYMRTMPPTTHFLFQQQRECQDRRAAKTCTGSNWSTVSETNDIPRMIDATGNGHEYTPRIHETGACLRGQRSQIVICLYVNKISYLCIFMSASSRL